MKINFSAPILDLDGTPMTEDGKPVSLSTLACRALLAVFPDEQALGGDTKINRYRIALKVNEGGEQELIAEDVASLKALIGKAYGPLAVGRAYAILEGE